MSCIEKDEAFKGQLFENDDCFDEMCQVKSKISSISQSNNIFQESSQEIYTDQLYEIYEHVEELDPADFNKKAHDKTIEKNSDQSKSQNDYMPKCVFCVLISTPYRLIRYDNVKYISLSTINGMIGILPNHSNMISSVQAGDIIIEVDHSYDIISDEITKILQVRSANFNSKKRFVLYDQYVNKNSNESKINLRSSGGLIKVYDNIVTILVENLEEGIKNNHKDG